jgi:Tol biopolymer transport system component
MRYRPPIVSLAMPRLGFAAAALLACASLGGCAGDATSTAPGAQLVAVGRLERGGTIRLVARGGLPAADSAVHDVVVTPASAGTVSGPVVRLLAVGAATVAATTSDGRTLTLALDVAAPPSVWFDAVASGNRDIYRVALDGGDLARLTTAAGDDASPTVSGGTLVYTSTRDGNAELYAQPEGGGAERRLTATAANEGEPALSADGTRVAYVSDASGAPRVYVASATLDAPARLTAAAFGFGGSLEAHPGWSPSGDRIALVATADGRATVYVSSSAPASAPAALDGLGTQWADVEPAWSPDGRRIAFASTRAGTTQLFVVDLQSGAVTPLTTGSAAAGQPTWLPDGRLVFVRYDGGATSLWWLDPDAAGEPVQIPLAGVAVGVLQHR